MLTEEARKLREAEKAKDAPAPAEPKAEDKTKGKKGHKAEDTAEK